MERSIQLQMLFVYTVLINNDKEGITQFVDVFVFSSCIYVFFN